MVSARDAVRGPRSSVTIEACVASVEDAVAAGAGGADRLELNRELERDGLTPSLDLFERVRDAVDLPIVAMVRPHDRGFHYSPGDLDDMERRIRDFVSAGASGIAAGPLTSVGRIDEAALGRLLEAAGSAEVVFHRAFDTLTDRAAALESLIGLGVRRVLTSGGAARAIDGADELERLVTLANGRIEILPGAGVSPDNAAALVRRTGCAALHGTFRAAEGSGTSAAVVAAVKAAAIAVRAGDT